MALAHQPIVCALIALGAVLVAGCSSFHQTLDNSTLADFRNNTTLQHWKIQGRVGIRDRSPGGTSGSASLNWQQCGEHFDIRLSGPLGAGAAHLYGNAVQTTLKRSGEQAVVTENPEQMLADIGWPLPVSALFDWVRGLPNPDQRYHIDPLHTGFVQAGWDLQFAKTFAVDQFIVPARAVLKKDQLQLTLLLKKWDLQSHCEAQ
ncbi:MAG: outer membrane lipoprotein LolB [Paraglaciecola psychrophila]|jgi:outer membrane lipoprotein LolB